ncbi:hypothetical protein HMPREF9019_0613 [Hoylesella timonensis CRIS 5C-B1]|uniref:Uncharacterized protein n=1 Tax=Hoylesella timonensis CRIS 5C-B1 TaxID=679189 RepID=D1VX48_9BACT|nr:hypothetical protein HMPREF9019_0613 [Hoylesella timonensis CRIS 5C-B1]
MIPAAEPEHLFYGSKDNKKIANHKTNPYNSIEPLQPVNSVKKSNAVLKSR